MKPALVQVTESADGYEPATVALFALFVVMLVVTAGLLLRDLLQSGVHARDDVGAGVAPMVSDPVLRGLVQPVTDRPTPQQSSRLEPASPQPPAWFRQAVAGQTAGATDGVRATIEHMVEAANRGDLRLGFSLYTPELLVRQQLAMGLDPGEFERLLRSAPRPADPQMVIHEISEITLDPPHRAYAIVSYEASEQNPRTRERLAFIYDDRNLVWLVDDIKEVPQSQGSR